MIIVLSFILHATTVILVSTLLIVDYTYDRLILPGSVGYRQDVGGSASTVLNFTYGWLQSTSYAESRGHII